MVSHRIEQLLKKELERLSEPQQERVIEFARSLCSKLPNGMSGDELAEAIARLREIISPEDAREIGEIIERDCEQIDPDAW